MSRLDLPTMVTLCRAVGFPDIPMALSIAMAESGFDAAAVNTTGNTPPSRDRGLFQINDHWHPEVSDAVAFDAAGNTREAFRISNGGTNWSPWSTFTNGAYKRYYTQFQQEVTGVSQLEQTIANAESQLGYQETGTNVNRFTEWMGGNDAEWCAAFVSWCAYQAGVRFPTDSQFGEKGWEYVPYMAAHYRSVGRYDTHPARGDFGILNSEVHVTLVESVDGSGVHTIEGNEGNAVMHMTRPLSAFEGFCHVQYEEGEDDLPFTEEQLRAIIRSELEAEVPRLVDDQLNQHGLAKSPATFPAAWADDIVNRVTKVQ